MSILHNVNLSELIYPCALYIKHRLNLQSSVEDIFNARGVVPKEGITYNIGDILIWESKDWGTTTDATVLLTDRGIVTQRAKCGRHLCVYEGDGLISDLVFEENEYIPHIRMHRLRDKRPPVALVPYGVLS